jgi:NADPH-dependent curcumin reductase CurA
LAGAIGVIYASENESFRVGDLVQGSLGWEDYSLVCKAEGLTPLKPSNLPLSYHLGVLEMQGLTAYAGLPDIGAPKAGETVYVSSASGVVGQFVGQLAKLRGARVVAVLAQMRR